jgi:hypothetical protein
MEYLCLTLVLMYALAIRVVVVSFHALNSLRLEQ